MCAIQGVLLLVVFGCALFVSGRPLEEIAFSNRCCVRISRRLSLPIAGACLAGGALFLSRASLPDAAAVEGVLTLSLTGLLVSMFGGWTLKGVVVLGTIGLGGSGLLWGLS